ncbi:dorsal-ventral patterning tolloid-like protein 1 [Ciona intestinalis]
MEMEQCCDKLEIRDGQNGRIIATLKYSSINEPLLYTSTTGRLYITMTSDTSVPKRGFKADISVLTAENERLLSSCGFTSYASSTPAQILTPNYPDDHPPNMNCHWLIKAPSPNTQVELHINDFRVEACCDHLEIRDGNNADSPMLTRLNDNLPANSTFTSTFGALYLRFFSDSSTNYRGFNGTFKIAGTTAPTTGPDSGIYSNN